MTQSPVADTHIGATHPSAPRPGSTLPISAAPSATTTLPAVQWNPTGAVLEPRSLPRYEVLDVLGQGGMGEVLRARDNDIGREVAVKRLRAEHQHPELFARFVEEVRTVGQLEHPNIVPIHDAGLDAQGYFFVMKRVEGESVDAIIGRLAAGDAATHAQWPLEARLAVVRKVLEALRYAHARGVVHRDIKPANILVGPMGEVFLLDWGIAKRDRGVPDAMQTQPATSDAAFETHVGAVMGTPLYMSPEQARGEQADARSDLYSLCLTAYEFLTLKHPFAAEGNTARVLKAVLDKHIPFPSLNRHPKQRQVPMDIGWLIHKGVAKDPAARYPSAEALLKRMDDRAEGNVPIQCHMTATKRLSYEALKLVNRNPALYALAVLAAIAGGVYALFFR